MHTFRSIVITGASSGIGEALALDYAAPGAALALTGRDKDRLVTVAASCRDKGAAVTAGVIDVVDRERLAHWLKAFDNAHAVDLVIANAGISIDKDNASIDDFSLVRRTFDVNMGGVLNTVEPLLARMMTRRYGQIALMSSLAGFIGMPKGPGYNASKAAVRVWGESIRYELRKHGVGVSVVCPGFVVSRMSATGPFPQPFLMPAARASAIIRRGLARDQARIAFPIPTKAGVWFVQALPARWTNRLFGR
jgi:short-subunit dehydrogenase